MLYVVSSSHMMVTLVPACIYTLIGSWIVCRNHIMFRNGLELRLFYY